MKKRITVIAILVVVVVMGVLFVGCGKEFNPPEKIIGLSKPTAAPVTAINKNMDAKQMFLAGIDNFYGADYVATLLAGQVNVDLGIKVTQYVFGTKIRDGKATTQEEKDSAIYFVDNKSYSSFVQVYEETIVNQKASNPDDRVKYISYKGRKYEPKKDPNGAGILGWGNSKGEKGKSFDSVPSLVTEMKNDPTRIWMYKTTADTISKASEVTLNKTTGQYEFTIELDISKSTEEYRKVMLHMLNASVKVADENLKFTGLKFNVKMWDNGYISELGIEESYNAKIELTSVIKLNSEITLQSVQQYSYDKNEKGFDIASRLEASKSWPKNM